MQIYFKFSGLEEDAIIMNEILSAVGTVVVSLGGSAVIILGLSAWIGKIWANRLMEADKAMHKKELEIFKASLTNSIESEKANYLRELEVVKTQLEQSAADRTRKLQALMRHYERQIEEFYGPLYNLANQILYTAHDVQRDLLEYLGPGNEDKSNIIKEYYRVNYFAPIHDKIYEILKTRLYLVEGAAIPKTFDENLRIYLRHTIQEKDQRALWRDHGIDTSFLKGVDWPWHLHGDIREGFETAMRNYQKCLDGLKEEARAQEDDQQLGKLSRKYQDPNLL
jgi:hypothetical protein